MDKTILLASFIPKEKLERFIGFLDTEFKITKDKVFCYENLSDQSRLVVTFKLTLEGGTHIDIKKKFPNTIMVHKRGDAFYTINALNELIKSKFGDQVDVESIKVDWSEYQNKVILLDNGKLNLLDIKRIF